MTREEMLTEVRRRIGNPGLNDVTNRELMPLVDDALTWLADSLKYHVVTTSTAIALTTDQRDYPLPSDFVEMFLVEWDTRRLTEQSTSRWDRIGTDWRNSASGTLNEYAIEGHRLILNPAPTAAVVTTSGTLTLRYAATPGVIGASGPIDLPPLDHSLACWGAAEEWLGLHPSEENMARLQFATEQIKRRLPGARRRAQNALRSYRPRWFIRPYRSGASR